MVVLMTIFSFNMLLVFMLIKKKIVLPLTFLSHVTTIVPKMELWFSRAYRALKGAEAIYVEKVTKVKKCYGVKDMLDIKIL